jgi:hypothetical protein
MKIKLEYQNGEVKATESNHEVDESKMFGLFKDYYIAIKTVYGEQMKRMATLTGRIPIGRLEINLKKLSGIIK